MAPRKKVTPVARKAVKPLAKPVAKAKVKPTAKAKASSVAKSTQPTASKANVTKANITKALATPARAMAAPLSPPPTGVPPERKEVRLFKTMPSAAEQETLKAEDQGYALAKQNAVKFLHGRRQAVFNIARGYRLDPEELLQEGYETLLTCLRDFTPVVARRDGGIMQIAFTTFFGSRMDSRAMELRNRDPEYQARQAHTADMTDDERAQFRANPPLLVQHLDQENAVQEALRNEASSARAASKGSLGQKMLRDGFFDKKLAELVAKERDEKKRAALMQVKVGGIFSFQELAYHFGVTDSRASQILNELMDAFYVQRMMEGDAESVAYDFKKLKFNEKRVTRLLQEALSHVAADRAAQLVTLFSPAYPAVASIKYKPVVAIAAPQESEDGEPSTSASHGPVRLRPFKDVVTEAEGNQFPLLEISHKPIAGLTPLAFDFRSPLERNVMPEHIVAMMAQDPASWPVLVNEQGEIIDGQRRFAQAKALGHKTMLCMVRRVTDAVSAKMLRVAVNARLQELDKQAMYWGIVALAEAGFSQQKIADALGTSRTNVIVYMKVKDKATPVLRRLFEDGFIQITNASLCVDMQPKVQEKVSTFIRAYGAVWGKGSKFNELMSAIQNSKL
ncbi:MAG: ParB N-terminal domain-containing protein, partial [Alphaproteobacteria bacterium]